MANTDQSNPEAPRGATYISKSAKAGDTNVVSEKRAELWREANKAALKSSNEYVEQHGLPLAKFRNL